jgi:hypothetical protein
VTDYSANDESTLYYDWLADSATTSHITNRHDTFVSYEPIQDTPITGVGGLKVQAVGCGDVNIQCLKKLVKCFELFECSGNISRTREGKNM